MMQGDAGKHVYDYTDDATAIQTIEGLIEELEGRDGVTAEDVATLKAWFLSISRDRR